MASITMKEDRDAWRETAEDGARVVLDGHLNSAMEWASDVLLYPPEAEDEEDAEDVIAALRAERDAALASRDEWRRLAGEGAAVALALVEDEHAVGERGDAEDDLAEWARSVDGRLTDPNDK